MKKTARIMLVSLIALCLVASAVNTDRVPQAQKGEPQRSIGGAVRMTVPDPEREGE